MIKIDLKRHRKEIIGSVVVLLILLGGMSVFKYTSFNSGFEIVDDLGGNIFPSAILSVATTDAQVIVPSDSTSLGNPKSCIAVRLKSKTAYSRVRIEVAETPFFSRSVSEFVLNKPRTEYTIYPDIIWNYEALKNEVQAEPVSVAITVEMNGKDLGQRVRTFSVRSINECLLGYVANGTKFHDTSIFFAAYVNEENPMIDQLLREALNTRIVNRFLGYQSKAKGAVDKQYMPFGIYCRNVNSVIVLFPIPAFRAMLFSRSVSVRLMMHWNLHRLIVWMGVCCLRRCFAPLILILFWYVHPGTCL